MLYTVGFHTVVSAGEGAIFGQSSLQTKPARRSIHLPVMIHRPAPSNHAFVPNTKLGLTQIGLVEKI